MTLDPFRRFRLAAIEQIALKEQLPPGEPLSLVWMEALPRELAPVLDPFPFIRNVAHERNLLNNRGLLRRVYSADDADTRSLRDALARAGWKETAPDHFECALAVCIVRDHGRPNAAVIIDAGAAFELWTSRHPDNADERFADWYDHERRALRVIL
jgi:hypothetical protein